MESEIFKQAAKENVLRGADNFLNAIINSIVAGYKPELVFNDVMEAVRSQEVSRGSFSAAPEILIAAFEEYLEAAKTITEKMKESHFYVDKEKKKEPEKPREKIPYNENFLAASRIEGLPKQAISADFALNTESLAVEVDRLSAPPEDTRTVEHPTSKKDDRDQEMVIKVTEDWENTKENKEALSGELILDMSDITGDMPLKEGDLNEEEIAFAVYSFLLNEHPKLKRHLKEIEYGNFEIEDPHNSLVRMTFRVPKRG